ncbi:DUF2628 domain-containing protein [Aestuariivirga sp.]|uniref:DUF2628 domain-containing protein n=1 Tax=Aestuariivirga sp. TaxID=2650926 RepID=UPI0035942F6B
MALYTVLEAPDGRVDRVAFVKEGFSGAALVLTVIWALWNRMWIVAAIIFAILVALSVSVSAFGLNEASMAATEFGLALIFGFEARRLKVMSLERAGFRKAGLVEASSLEAAELDYFSQRRQAVQPAPVLTTYRPQPHDTLGIFGNV